MPNTEEKELVEYLLQANKVGYGEKKNVPSQNDSQKLPLIRGCCEVLRSVMDGGVDFYNKILTSRLEVVIVLVMCE